MAREGHDARGGTLRLEESGPTLQSPLSSISEVATTIALDSDSAPVAVDPSPASFGGEINRRYDKRKSLGEGGMGEVILCKDQWIGREVAKKIAHKGRGSRPPAEGRFLREVRIQGQLEHPGIVPVYDLGRDDEGATYFTMKRIKGHTLEAIVSALRDGDPETESQHSRRKLLSAMGQVCLTVAFAHSRGVVHRDLKPANVMLGDFGEVYVLDWGVAKVRGVEDDACIEDPIEPQAGGRTEAGALLGTPGYMAPEQVRGDNEAIDARSDVYALGAILFELLALEPLHRGRTLEALFASTFSGAGTSPAERAPDRDVPEELDDICRRALAQNPDERFHSAREMHDAIELFLDGQRDLERRRELASAHAQSAKRALEAQNDEGAAAAMRELGSALALDPTNKEALQTMVEVLLQPTDDLPPPARAELESVMRRDRIRAARRVTVVLLTWYLGTPLIYLMGIRDWRPIIVLDVLLLSLVLYQWWMAKTGNVMPKHMRWAIPLSFAAIGSAGAFLGPFVVVPAVAVGSAAAMMVGLRANRQTRHFITVCALGAVFVPAGLQFAGLLPASYAFEAGVIKVLPLATGLPPLWTGVFMVLATVITIVSGAALVSKATGALIEAERRLFGQAYRLRHLLPDAARPVTLPPPASTPGCRVRAALSSGS